MGRTNEPETAAAGKPSWRVLVVDDSRTDRLIVMRLLAKQADVDVVEAIDGADAIQKLNEGLKPDLVLTDMSMPNVDGLGLVEHVHRNCPGVFSILMTAQGSEELAVEALQAGASHYVPKRNFARDLVRTCESVLAIARNQRRQAALADYWLETSCSFRLPNHIGHIPDVIAYVQNCSLGTHNPRADHRMSVALHEALVNAIHHGNLELSSELRDREDGLYYQLAKQRAAEEPYDSRHVHVTITATPTERRFVVRDEGPGFDPATPSYDPEDPEQLMRTHGRGLFLIRTFMDEVSFNDQGNEITLVQRQTSPSGAAVR